MQTITDPKQALKRYKKMRAKNRLIQGVWSEHVNGSRMACAVGILGPNVLSVDDCPWSIMPLWCADYTTLFFDALDKEDAFAWGEKLYSELARLKGDVPISVLHKFQADTMCKFFIDSELEQEENPRPWQNLRQLHLKTLKGRNSNRETWVNAISRTCNAYYGCCFDRLHDIHPESQLYSYICICALERTYTEDGVMQRLAYGLIECLKQVPSKEKNNDD